jgi:hypothetical protein
VRAAPGTPIGLPGGPPKYSAAVRGAGCGVSLRPRPRGRELQHAADDPCGTVAVPAEKVTEGRAETPSNDGPFAVPASLRPRLAAWIDVEEVGQPGFWDWLETVLPALPSPSTPDPETARPSESARVRRLARDLVDCARDRARLTVLGDRYFRDNQVLAIRLKALEAALETTRRTGPPSVPDEDSESAEAAERYLPQG